ncbi:MAG: hypothetical protein ACREIM_10825 [Nitrospiraceae bacterium]
MRGYITQIEDATVQNSKYRQVLFTATHSQLVLMSLKPGEEIGEEVHELDQFIRSRRVRERSCWIGKNILCVTASQS